MIGIMTADRPALLERALTSYIKTNQGNRNDVEYIVYDDSKGSAASQASFEVARKLQRQFDLPIRFAGIHERTRYAQQLGECANVAPEILEYALLVAQGYTLGQNRNALLLDSVGSMVFCADDDTIGAPVNPLRKTKDELQLCSGADPAEFWCFRNSSEARTVERLNEELDLLQAHERLLGRSAAEITFNDAVESSRAGQHSEDLMARIRNRRSVVRITLNGLLGDCAWGTPFGLWHEPMGYLAFSGESLERLTASEDFYRQATQSRQLLRATSGPVLGDASFSMLTFWGLDNRELLPPNPPTHRGQDLIFGQILWKCFGDSLFGHVPMALIHDPIPSRKFWPGEMTRSAAGVDLCRVMLETIKLCPFVGCPNTPEDRLKILGQHLRHLGGLPGEALGEQLMECLRESNRRFTCSLTDRSAPYMHHAPYYANDVMRFFDKLKKAEESAQYWIPLDLWGVDGFVAAEPRLRRTLDQFGTLLEYWPTLVNGARLLRDCGIRVSVPV
jgi:hypothetical protein